MHAHTELTAFSGSPHWLPNACSRCWLAQRLRCWLEGYWRFAGPVMTGWRLSSNLAGKPTDKP